MSNIVIYDSLDIVVANRVISYLLSVNTPDYDLVFDKLVNPDVTSVLAVNQHYWKVSSDSVVEMTQQEKTAIDNFLKAKTVRDKKYKISTYDDMQRLTTIVFFDTDNGDGTYSGKAEETTYTYFEDKVALLHKNVKTYHFDGTEHLIEDYNYYKNDNNELIEKKV